MTENERQEILEAMRLPLRIERDWTWTDWPEEEQDDGAVPGLTIFSPA